MRLSKIIMLVALAVSILLGCGKKGKEPTIPESDWTEQQSSTTKCLSDVFFLDEAHGWAVETTYDLVVDNNGDSTLVHGYLVTTDGGFTWQRRLISAPIKKAHSYQNRVYFSSPSRGLIFAGLVGSECGYSGIPADDHSGAILETDDGGVSWDFALSSIPSIMDIFFLTPEQGFICGMGNYSEHGVIRATTNGGNSWSSWAAITDYGRLQAIFLLDPNTAFVGTNLGAIYKTTDAGASWQQRSFGREEVFDIHLVDRTNGWSATTDGIHKTTDGGATWVQSSSKSAKRLWFANENVGWAIIGGKIHSTEDGGDTWEEEKFSSNSGFLAMSFLEDSEGWAVGRDGKIVHYKKE